MSGYPDSPEIAMARVNHLMNQSQNNVAAVLKVNNSTELYPSYNTPQTAVSLVNIQKPSSYRNNTTWGNQLAHTPLSLGWRLGCPASPVWDGGWGGSGVSVRTRGLCDISRLPIWLGEWTPSNYSCSYCLINLPVSPLHPSPQTHALSFSILFCKRAGERKKTIEWQDTTKHNRDSWKANEIIQHHSTEYK